MFSMFSCSSKPSQKRPLDLNQSIEQQKGILQKNGHSMNAENLKVIDRALALLEQVKSNTPKSNSTSKIELLTRLATELHTEYIALNSEKNALQGNFNTVKQVLQGNFNTLATENQSLQESVTTLDTAKQALQGNFNTLTTENQSLQESVTTLDTAKQALQGNFNTLTTENQSLQGSVTTLNNEKNALQRRFDALDTAKQALQGNFNTLTTENQSLQGRFDALTGKNKKIVLCSVVALATLAILGVMYTRYGTLNPRSIWRQIFPKKPEPCAIETVQQQPAPPSVQPPKSRRRKH